VFGQPLTLTASVNSPTGTPTGTVTFKDGNTVLGSAAVNAAGQATLTLTLLVGSHALTASFAATGAFTGSTSAVVPETVNPAATATSLRASATSVPTGRPVTFTATVTALAPGAGTPTGTVTFIDGNMVLGTGALNGSGAATLTISSLPVGQHAITAVYSGAATFAGSTPCYAPACSSRRWYAVGARSSRFAQVFPLVAL
jgi:hypothetical protein